MNVIYLNNKEVHKTDIDLMELNELNGLMYEVQEEIHKTAIEKNRLSTLPKNKKDGKTFTKVRKCTEKIMYLQDAVNYISNAKKAKRDTQVSEKEWYKRWYQLAKMSLPKRTWEKIDKDTVSQMGYSI